MFGERGKFVCDMDVLLQVETKRILRERRRIACFGDEEEGLGGFRNMMASLGGERAWDMQEESFVACRS